jgi:arylsulfatase A-like enzyme
MHRSAVALACFLVLLVSSISQAAAKPNIVFILADDMGVGDVMTLSKRCRIATPNLDRLASQGMAFTDAHTSSSVCTPTRYAILTGRYNWRSRLKNGVCWGWSRRLIEDGRMTVGSFLQQNGYSTAAIGKWHLGMSWPLKNGGFADDGDTYRKDFKNAYNVDYFKPVQNGPTSVGFDTFFGISASLDMPPYVYIQNDKPLVTKIVTKAFHRDGPADVDFEDVDVLPRLTEETVKVINDRADESKNGKPFFIYFPLNAPHTPISPTKEFAGKSGLNKYGDFVMQVDWTVGQVMAALDSAGVAGNTLLIFTTDNGCSPQANFPEEPLPQRRLSRPQGRHLRRRSPRPVHRPLAEPRQIRIDEFADDRPARPLRDRRRHPRPGSPGDRRRRQRQHPAGLARPGQTAAAGSHRASFDQRLVLNPAGKMEAGSVSRFRRLERTASRPRRLPREAGSAVIRPRHRHRRNKERR